MKRDMDLVRKIVLAIEAREDTEPTFELPVEGYDRAVVRYHLILMLEGGLIEGSYTRLFEADLSPIVVSRLSWEGCEFADAARDDTLWAKAKATIKDKAGSASLAVVKEVLQGLVRSTLGL